MSEKIKIVFFGTPEFAAKYLQGLLSDSDFNVSSVVTQPDRPAGRNQEITFSPVKQLAIEKGIKVLQPDTLKNNLEILDQLKEIQAELFVVVAYGSIIPQEIIDLPKSGTINVHPSALPKYRGASPIQSALLSGEKKTCVTIMLIDAKMDHGPILSQKEIELTGEETNDYLHDKIADISVDLLAKTIKDYLSGKIKPREQDHSLATFCKIIDKSQAQINWSLTAKEIKQKINAFHPWPGTWTLWNGKRIKLFPPVEIIQNQKRPGEVFLSDKNLAIGCGQDALIIHRLQIEGKKEMTAEEFIRGYNNFIGGVLD